MHNYHSKLLLYSISRRCAVKRPDIKSGIMTFFKVAITTLALLTLSFAGFAASFTGHLIASNLGTYMDSFGSSATAIGLVIGSLALAEVIFKTPVRHLIRPLRPGEVHAVRVRRADPRVGRLPVLPGPVDPVHHPVRAGHRHRRVLHDVRGHRRRHVPGQKGRGDGHLQLDQGRWIRARPPGRRPDHPVPPRLQPHVLPLRRSRTGLPGAVAVVRPGELQPESARAEAGDDHDPGKLAAETC